MLEKLASLEARYNELTEEIAKPEVIADQTTWQKLMKAHADLEPVVETYRAYKAALEAVDEAKGILEEEKDAELRELAQMQLDEQREEAANLEQQLKILLLPKDPNDDKNVIYKRCTAAMPTGWVGGRIFSPPATPIWAESRKLSSCWKAAALTAS